MDPFSISVGCVGLLGALMTVSTKLHQFSLTIRERQDEIVILRRELDSFQRSINTFCEGGLADECPREIRSDLYKIMLESRSIVDELGRLVERMQSNRLTDQLHWSLAVKTELTRLRQSLESHKAAINIAIAASSMSVTCSIKRDTGSMRSKVQRIPELEHQLDQIMVAVQNLTNARTSRRPLSNSMQRYLRDTRIFAETVAEADADEDELDSLYRAVEAQMLPQSPVRTNSSQSDTLVSDGSSVCSHPSEKYQHRGAFDEYVPPAAPLRRLSGQPPSPHRMHVAEIDSASQTSSDAFDLPRCDNGAKRSPFEFQDTANYICENPAPPILRRFNTMSTLSRRSGDSCGIVMHEDWSQAHLCLIAHHLTHLATRGRAVVECRIAKTNRDLRDPPPCLKRMRYLEAQLLRIRDSPNETPSHKELGSCAPPLPSSCYLDLSSLGDCAYTYEFLRSRTRRTYSLKAADDLEAHRGQEFRFQVLIVAATLAWMMARHGDELRLLEGESFPNLLRTAMQRSAEFGVKMAQWPVEEKTTYEMAIQLGCLPALLGLARLLLNRNQKGDRLEAAQCLRLWEVEMRQRGTWNHDASVRNDWAWKSKYDPVKEKHARTGN